MRRRRRLSVVVLAAIAALIVAAVASASGFVDSGTVNFGDGTACSGCTVHIKNNTTGATGSTTTITGGTWSAQGFVAGDNYTVWADDTIGSCFYPNTNTKSVTQPSFDYDFPVLTVSGTANQGGCPHF